jgi:quercetin dioxygenase-like cupin family protein
MRQRFGSSRREGAANRNQTHRSPAARSECPGREVIQTIVELDPGVTSSRHTHPGEEIIYVLEGAPFQVEGKQSVTLKPGDFLFIPAGTVHAAKNVGTRKGAELATYIVEKGKPLLTEVGDRSSK